MADPSVPPPTADPSPTVRFRLAGATLDGLVKEAGKQLEATLAVLRLPQFDLTLTYEASSQKFSGAPLRPAIRKLLAVTQLNDSVLPLPVTLEHGGPALAVPIHDVEQRPVGALAVIRVAEGRPFIRDDARELVQIAERLSKLLQRHHDEMTGVLTRPIFESRATRLLMEASLGEKPLTLLYVDVDRLHVVNETYGYAVGDDVLRLLARMLVAQAPPGAIVGRVAGDRFGVLTPVADSSAALALGAELCSQFEGHELRADGERVPMTVSIGAAYFAGEPSLEEAQNRAQLACRIAKERGGGRTEIYCADDTSVMQRESELELMGEVFQAVQHDQFQLLAQPIVPLAAATRSTPAFEVLLRLRRDRELLAPSVFLSAAERYQLMPSIDRWVVRRTLAQLAPHLPALEASGTRFAINLSGQSLGDPQFAEFLERQLRAQPGLARHLTFEITETAAVARLQPALALMFRLRELGCEFALDDFGAGMSSFAYLRDLPVQRLKIDASFVRDLAVDRVAEAMVKATREVAGTLGLAIVAEGVETEAARRRLEALSIPHAQGYLFGVPTPLAGVLTTTLPALVRRSTAARPAADAADEAPAGPAPGSDDAAQAPEPPRV